MAGAIAIESESSISKSSENNAQLLDSADRFLNEGLQHYEQSQFQTALEHYQLALSWYEKLGDRLRQGAALNNIGLAHQRLGNYRQASSFYDEALAIAQAEQSQSNAADVFNNLGFLHSELGQFDRALAFHQQALVIYRGLRKRPQEGITLMNIGLVYERQNLYRAALIAYEKSLTIRREIGDRKGESLTLNNIGMVYYRLGELDRSQQALEASVSLAQTIQNSFAQAYSLDSLAKVYAAQNQPDRAWELYQQSFAIFVEISDRPGQRIVLANMGDLLVQEQQNELAIVFYKRSINITETIRRDLQGLPVEQQQSYTNTVAETYRKLADLLLQADRILEAQQVLDLLKIQELEDYLRRVRSNDRTAQGVDLSSPEQTFSYNYDGLIRNAIAESQELTRLQRISVDELTDLQRQRISVLEARQQQMRVDFHQFLDRPDVRALIRRVRDSANGENIELRSLPTLQRQLRALNSNTVLFYPFILNDRIELILLTANAPPIRQTVPVSRIELNRAITSFRSALADRNSDATIPAQQLYHWLIRPIQPYLDQANAETILYAPDGSLRYIPLAALHDGDRWLAQRYRVNTILALSLMSLASSPPTEPHILAAAFANGRYIIRDRYAFSGLEYAAIEVQQLSTLFNNTTQLIDRAFNRRAITTRLSDYTIIHLATHAMFNTGEPEDSFIVLGDGDVITLDELPVFDLSHADLIVLSACQTGVSSVSGTGEEILGFGYQIHQAGAKAAIASLWSVEDNGTQGLMSQFYTQLRQGNFSRLEALQQAQIALITDNSSTFSHPYYWAAFFLIGNGL